MYINPYQKIKCECGLLIAYAYMSRHTDSDRHKNKMGNVIPKRKRVRPRKVQKKSLTVNILD